MDKNYKRDFIQAGAIAGQVRTYGKNLVKSGASYNDVIKKIYNKITELGASPAFPPQMALNEVAAHFLVQPHEDIIFSDQLVKLDVGVSYKGAIGDCAVTIDLSGKYQALIDAAESALLQAENSVKVGLPIREIGKTIAETINSYGFQPIKNLSGHGLGPYKIHTLPTIPNYDDNSKGRIKPGMTFAIEPFATNGKGLIYEKGKPAIFAFARPGSPRTDTGRLLLEKVKSFNGLPFAIHDMMESMPFIQVEMGINELLRLGIIVGYPPLIEEKQGMVAQAENSVLVDENGQVLITTRLM
ncbi:MAG: type II methionyl aminopeptidase [Candidatus Protochlamydia sp.]|nr:type II methionyl aminopeptidase [Candidatus Protochlamydia sp.]